MGTPDDRDHFEDYREQTRVKHEILAAYLGPYFSIVGKGYNRLLYIDGFAGRGTYKRASDGEVFNGSPLHALKLVAGNPDFAQKVDSIFIEADKELYPPLQDALINFWSANRQIREPITHQGEFADGIKELMRVANGKLPPTFLFVDPCGVSGTSFDAIRSVMGCKSSEAFIFFNVDGVRRIFGLPNLSEVLADLLGSTERAAWLSEHLRKEQHVFEREKLILDGYKRALRDDMGVKYIIPFRVESEAMQKTSHYLIHACNHPLGFKIMKEVMWKRGQSEYGQRSLQFVQASRTEYFPLIDPQYNVKRELVQELENGPKCVDLFYNDWVCRPDDLQCKPAYKQALIEMEASGQIEVLDKDGRTPKPVKARKAYNGQPTLGEGYFVRLAKRSS